MAIRTSIGRRGVVNFIEEKLQCKPLTPRKWSLQAREFRRGIVRKTWGKSAVERRGICETGCGNMHAVAGIRPRKRCPHDRALALVYLRKLMLV